VQRPHQHLGQGLRQGVLPLQFGQRLYDGGGVALAEFHLRQQKGRVDTSAVPCLPYPLGPRTVQPGQRLAAPQGERLAQQRHLSAGGLSGPPGQLVQPTEPVQVHLVLARLQLISAGAPQQP